MSELTAIETLAIPDALQEVFRTCAKENNYQEGAHVFTSFDLFQATVSGVNTEQDSLKFSKKTWELLNSSKFLMKGEDGDSVGTRAVHGVLGAGLAIDAVVGMMISVYSGENLGNRVVVLLVVNGFDEPLIQETTTYEKGSSSGYMSGYPCMMDKDGKLIASNGFQIPKAFSDENGSHYHGVGVYVFKRKHPGFTGVDGGIRFSCASKECKNGVNIGFQNGVSGAFEKNREGDYKVTVSMNATELPKFKERWIDDEDENSDKAHHSSNSTSEIWGSIFPMSLWGSGGEAERDVMVVTAVVGPK